MSGRQCQKEEWCCRKATAAVEAFEAGLAAGNFENAPNWRAHIRDVIDECAQKIEGAQIAYINSPEGSDNPPDNDEDDG